MRNTQTQTSLLTLAEAVDEGYAAYSTLRSWIAKGRLPATRCGRRILIHREDLDALCHPARSVTDITAWARAIARTAPPLSQEKAAEVARILQGVA
ncbi:helix-turn-helix domain-containing protein [Corynebacterium nuruki]|uniref:helix-turn-helix domain-containing protein n=1 Tax=Corynebacterium nuruki TaxID=1032851 RepID=UPI002FE03E90